MTLLLAKFNNKLININDYGNEMKGNIHCNCCDEIMIAKKGNRKIHHFAHKTKINCDEWYHTHKTEWHLLWQNICKDKYKEFVIKKDDVKHIADIYDETNNRIIEIQHSQISDNDISKREEFYDNMVWIIDLIDKCKISIIFVNCVIVHSSKTDCFSMNKPVFFDTQYGILKLLAPMNTGYCVCEFVDIKIFLETYFALILCDTVTNTTTKIKTNHKEKINMATSLEINYKKTEKNMIFEGLDFNDKKLRGKYSLENNSGILEHLGFVCNTKEKKWKIDNAMIRFSTKDVIAMKKIDNEINSIINDICLEYDENKLKEILKCQNKNKVIEKIFVILQSNVPIHSATCCENYCKIASYILNISKIDIGEQKRKILATILEEKCKDFKNFKTQIEHKRTNIVEKCAIDILLCGGYYNNNCNISNIIINSSVKYGIDKIFDFNLKLLETINKDGVLSEYKDIFIKYLEENTTEKILEYDGRNLEENTTEKILEYDSRNLESECDTHNNCKIELCESDCESNCESECESEHKLLKCKKCNGDLSQSVYVDITADICYNCCPKNNPNILILEDDIDHEKNGNRWIYILKKENSFVKIGITNLLYKKLGNNNCTLVAIYKTNIMNQFVNYNRLTTKNNNNFVLKNLEKFGNNYALEKSDGLYGVINSLMLNNKNIWKNTSINGREYEPNKEYISNDSYMRNLPLCKCGYPCDIKKDNNKNCLFFRCAKKNMWDSLKQFNVDMSACNFYKVYDKDRIILNENLKSDKKVINNITCDIFRNVVDDEEDEKPKKISKK